MIKLLGKARSDREGFTMAELLVVVVVLVVLAAIAVPIFLNQLEKAEDASTASNVGAVSTFAANSLGSESGLDGGDGTSVGDLTSPLGFIAKNGALVHADTDTREFCISQISPSGTVFAASTHQTITTEVTAVCETADFVLTPVDDTPDVALDVCGLGEPGAPAAYQPSSVTAVALSSTSAVVSWDAGAVPDGEMPITSYRVTTFDGCAPVMPPITAMTPDGDTTTMIVTGLSAGVEYTFRVVADSAAGSGPESFPSSPLTLN